MADAEVLNDGVLTLLRTILNLSVYDGEVPESPPADADGRVFPYAVSWGSGGYRPPESRSLETGSTSDLRWRARVTVAAGRVAWVLRAAKEVRGVLDGRVLVPYSSPLEEDGSASDVLEDRDVFPHRMFLPMSFICTTG